MVTRCRDNNRDVNTVKIGELPVDFRMTPAPPDPIFPKACPVDSVIFFLLHLPGLKVGAKHHFPHHKGTTEDVAGEEIQSTEVSDCALLLP